MSTRTKVGLGFQEYFGVDEVFDLSTPSVFYSDPVEKEVKPLYSTFVKAGEMHAVPPPITGTYMPSPYQSDIEETQVSYGSKSDNNISDTISESNDFVSCDNSDKSSDSETHASCDSSLKTQTKDIPPAVDIQTLPESDVENSTTGSPSFSCSENVKSPRIICNKSGVNNRKVCKNNFVRVKKCFVCGSKLHLIKDCDFYNCVDSVPCKFKAASVPAGSRNSSASVPADRSDPADSRNRPAVNPADRPHPAGWSKRPATVSAGRPVSAGWLNPAARSVYNTNWPNIYDPMIKGRWGTAGDPSTDNDIGIVDSGCSRSMTGNKEKLDDFVQIKGGIVKFGGGDGRISGKGTIRTSKLDFENVYYVEELQHFNLFSVSQICDKKNKVLFTDTDCLVLSEEFQLPDASQVVLRIPRKHDLYTFHISDLQPEQKVTCLVAKASLDESTRWHRRMAHVNFKTINKLAKEGLVDGLPLKVFTNEHNCVACNKGKQHKASYKHISAVRLITETLQLLHMDLFGPTNIRSIDQKYYSLVVTLNKKVKGIRCDNGTEFKNAKLIELCGEKGIKRDFVLIHKPHAARMGWLRGKMDSYRGCLEPCLADSKLLPVLDEAVSMACLCFKQGTQVTNINAGTQDHDSDSEVDEKVIVVPSFPSYSFAGPSSSNGPSVMEHNADYAKELSKLQRQEYEAKDVVARYGYLFSQETAEILSQAEAEIRNQGVSADRDPAGIDSAGGVSAGSTSAGIDSAGGVSAGSTSAGSDPAGGNLAGSFPPASGYEPADQGNPAVSTSVSADFIPVHADESTLPPGQSLGSSENTTRFPVPSDVCKDNLSSGIFTSSSYDDDFSATLTNLAPAVEVNPVPTKRVNTIHPQSQILGDLASPVLTRSRAQKSKFGESAFIGYIQDQQRTNHTDQLHCLFACFLSQLEPTSIAKALEDPDWVAAMQEEMQQFINQKVWTLVPLPDGKNAIGTKWILKNKRDARGIVVRNKARLVAQGHRQEEGIDYDEVFAPVARIEAIRLFLAFASYMGLSSISMDVKSAFLYKEIEEEVYVTQPKGFEDPYFPKHVYRVVKALYGLHQAPRAWWTSISGKKVNIRQCKKQTMWLLLQQSEYVAAASCCAQVLWIQNQLLDYGFNFMNTKIFIDNQSTICIVKNPVFHQRTKHIEIRHHFIRDANEKNLIQVLKIHTDDNVADLLTKAFDGPRFEYLVVHIGMGVCSCCLHGFLLVGLDSSAGLNTFMMRISAVLSLILLVDWSLPLVILVLLVVYNHAVYPQLFGPFSVKVRFDSPSVVFDSLVKQFWATAVVRPNAAGSHDLVATIDGREVVVTESLIRTQLQFDDANGIFDMPNNDILEGMRVIGYPTDGTLTFLKNHLSPQWRFLVHTLMHCLSPKSGSWNQFPSSIATALICLSTGNDAADGDDAAKRIMLLPMSS
ncbi:putative ribonuclease H-like domain-containing protein [Tanacetum coccineum]|uniref:Ribonuclease H-like domain-containing protein n=1 Tax=Tanacetum coccineum TaxID=301880 RepID=A0ABQ5IN69_9ASTR